MSVFNDLRVTAPVEHLTGVAFILEVGVSHQISKRLRFAAALHLTAFLLTVCVSAAAFAVTGSKPAIHESPEWWLQQSEKHARQIKDPELRAKALRWIESTRYADFDGISQAELRTGNSQPPENASASDMARYTEKLVEYGRLSDADGAMKATTRLHQAESKRVPAKLLAAIARLTADADRFNEAYTYAERIDDEGHRRRVLVSVLLRQVESQPDKAVARAKKLFAVSPSPILSSLQIAVAAGDVEFFRQVAKRELEQAKASQDEGERRRTIDRLLRIMSTTAAKIELEAMRKAWVDVVFRAHELQPRTRGAVAQILLRLGEIQKGLELAEVGAGPGRTSIGDVARAYMKLNQFEKAFKLGPQALPVIVDEYLRRKEFDKALQTAEKVPLETEFTLGGDGYRRNTTLFKVVRAHAEHGQTDKAIETLSRMVTVEDDDEPASPPAMQRIKYATRAAQYLTEPDSASLDPQVAGKLLDYAQKQLPQVPVEQRDNAVHDIRFTQRRLRRVSPKRRASARQIQELANRAGGWQKVKLLEQAAEIQHQAKQSGAVQRILAEMQKTAPAVKSAKDKALCWLAVARVAYLATDGKALQPALQAAMKQAWQATRQVIDAGKEDSVSLRAFTLQPLISTYYQIDAVASLPDAFQTELKTPFDRCAAFYTTGATLKQAPEYLHTGERERR